MKTPYLLDTPAREICDAGREIVALSKGDILEVRDTVPIARWDCFTLEVAIEFNTRYFLQPLLHILSKSMSD